MTDLEFEKQIEILSSITDESESYRLIFNLSISLMADVAAMLKDPSVQIEL